MDRIMYSGNHSVHRLMTWFTSNIPHDKIVTRLYNAVMEPCKEFNFIHKIITCFKVMTR